MRRRTLMKTSVSAEADVCLYDKLNDKLIIVPGADFSASAYPSSAYSPVGVVVVPSSHDVYGDGSCGVMSLKQMDYSTPDTGTTSEKRMYWGNSGSSNADISSLTNYNVVAGLGTVPGDVYDTIQGTKEGGYLPSNKSNFTGKVYPHDTDLKYYLEDMSRSCYIPSPYNDDDTRNPMYYQTSSPSSTANAMSDFDGVGNTRIITDLATAQSDWKTASSITNSSSSGYFPAACCCWRYHTDGTSQGDWYLPACGELGYIMPKFNQIQASINALISAYGDSVGVQLGSGNDAYSYYLSSTEHDYMYVRYVRTYNGRGGFEPKSRGYNVRAWLRVGA